MQNAIRDSYRPKNRAGIQEISGSITVTNPTPAIIIGADTDTAVEGDFGGSLSAKIRGLNKTITDLNTNIETLINNYQRPTFDLIREVLLELKTMNYYLHEGLNISDNPQMVKDMYEEEIKVIVH